MVVLTLIIAAFVTFGVTLASVSWYCRDTTNRAKCQHEDYPSATGLISDHE
jgi:hypothetical protein